MLVEDRDGARVAVAGDDDLGIKRAHHLDRGERVGMLTKAAGC
jgi:hypothetical protein